MKLKLNFTKLMFWMRCYGGTTHDLNTYICTCIICIACVCVYIYLNTCSCSIVQIGASVDTWDSRRFLLKSLFQVKYVISAYLKLRLEKCHKKCHWPLPSGLGKCHQRQRTFLDVHPATSVVEKRKALWSISYLWSMIYLLSIYW